MFRNVEKDTNKESTVKLQCICLCLIAAAASSSPAFAASRFGITHERSADGIDSAQPARCHLQLRPPVSVQHPCVTCSTGQRREERPRGGRRPS